MKKVFDTPGCNFEAASEAEDWCRERNIAVGSIQRGSPRGLLCGHYSIAKWRNLNDAERRELDGTMTGDMRRGPVVVELRGEESDYPIVEPEEEE
ncbi:hypothetical protein [Paraburkholderia caballeronis]|uniref:Uncharacterized protein n=1 Tax=Paraburkholderia caballeronis TaxID=416943 RepID=A0A1H7KY26_9BURK|nr:hypothetical protein [Paraburkholderia caballeronis]PXW28215.1 hypothetical protein C7403_102107 [Paraburkholderia caballeronis]PXX03581.1 hypothetical protein C7407_102107 [Paraburkholderia caballeronis]RAK04325.1 hypothetical protein C7409_102107 [Paraburkholderia caballeronis]SED84762.1 hypothetical protein SAMN05445871_4072 [Paraburkholderia caballeronis]SEK91689.1 hypothetical protein SAMN05192542_104107 [Paraburkholderia caballeronis]